VPQRLDRVHVRGPPRGIEPEHHADPGRDRERDPRGLACTWSREVAGADKEILLRFFADFFALAGKEITGSLEELKQLSEEELWRRFLEQARNADILPLGVDVSDLKNLLRIFKANRRALRTYQPASYPGRVVLFQASDGERPPIELAQSWKRVAAHLETQIVPGNHYQIVTEPHVQILAQRMKPFLEEIHAAV